MAKIRSYKGQVLDSDIIFGKDSTPAVGNMHVNAGGDIIDSNGNVVKGRDQVAREYHVENKKSVVTSSLLADLDDEEYTIQPDVKKPAQDKNLKAKAQAQAAESDENETE